MSGLELLPCVHAHASIVTYVSPASFLRSNDTNWARCGVEGSRFPASNAEMSMCAKGDAAHTRRIQSRGKAGEFELWSLLFRTPPW